MNMIYFLLEKETNTHTTVKEISSQKASVAAVVVIIVFVVVVVVVCE